VVSSCQLKNVRHENQFALSRGLANNSPDNSSSFRRGAQSAFRRANLLERTGAKNAANLVRLALGNAWQARAKTHPRTNTSLP
jgi:hypothetical protein